MPFFDQPATPATPGLPPCNDEVVQRLSAEAHVRCNRAPSGYPQKTVGDSPIRGITLLLLGLHNTATNRNLRS
jgi:hypothetical protein